jgi:hypothetical protein
MVVPLNSTQGKGNEMLTILMQKNGMSKEKLMEFHMIGKGIIICL